MNTPKENLPLEFKVLWWINYWCQGDYILPEIHDLMEDTNSDRSSVIKVLAQLVKDGLVYRGKIERESTVFPTDGQQSFQTYGLTAQGKKLISGIPTA